MAQKRNIFQVSIQRSFEDGKPRFSSKCTLPMCDADAITSETIAAMTMKTVNAQLDFAKSKYRLAIYDIETKQRMSVTQEP
jgi:hypothetical protein